jgi:hypothetical protein
MLGSMSSSSPLPPAQRSRWPYISLIPIGLGAWAPIYAGVKARTPRWVALGVLWSVVVIAGFVADSLSSHPGSDDLAGFLIIAGWVGSIATSFSIRGAYEHEIGSPLLHAAEAAELRLRDRRRALEIARTDPALAREIGVGRPDREGAADAGLVDVNNASVTALLKLTGVDGDVATQIVEGREKLGGFSSLEDMGVALDLDGALVERLRGTVVFLPRA